jgi:ubiquinone/menaquinone biosynthesis C-methylase UbiE
MTTRKNDQLAMNYIDFQAYVGITKHNGGFAATNELLGLCHIQDAQQLLNVGCGIGIGSTYIARKYGCHIVGVDISEKMIGWSRLRAREERVEDMVEFRVADVLELPFESDRFDIVFCESVLAFVEDKLRAIQECVRVTRPGGYVGLNETFWIAEASPEYIEWAQASQEVGAEILSAATWQALWEESGLKDRVVRICQLDPRREIKDRIQWVGWRWALRA